MTKRFGLGSCQEPGSGAVRGITRGHGTSRSDGDVIALGRCARSDSGKQIGIGDRHETREALTEDLCSGERVHRDVDIDVVSEVGREDLGSSYPCRLCRWCVRAEVRVEVGRERGRNNQSDPPMNESHSTAPTSATREPNELLRKNKDLPANRKVEKVNLHQPGTSLVSLVRLRRWPRGSSQILVLGWLRPSHPGSDSPFLMVGWLRPSHPPCEALFVLHSTLPAPGPGRRRGVVGRPTGYRRKSLIRSARLWAARPVPIGRVVQAVIVLRLELRHRPRDGASPALHELIDHCDEHGAAGLKDGRPRVRWLPQPSLREFGRVHGCARLVSLPGVPV